MFKGTKKLFPQKYKEFKSATIHAAEFNELPIAFELIEDKNFELNDFRDFFTDFKRDTGLDVHAIMYTCNKCNRLHVLIEVDTMDDEEPTVLN